ncbi:hypothetical protein EJ04DRAFT_605754 [Polyplosphaeria fusca]|uniref:Uncharacterized protein n=1 Tax=Polyplosphaeria fusca TaxID=682080 RepID=A0A9P4QYF3_9PLEO|nr:hypothetical protein EJ04DRAFT_605754 [Polyplosphaeria fusca]
MSELQAQFVKRGYWVNQADGPVMGQTITTDTRTGSIIISLLTLFTSLGLSHLWNLITYIWHQTRANGDPRDALFRQQQVLLRTFPSPLVLVADSFKIWLAWRRKTKGVLRRTWLHSIVAIVFKLATVAASILSAYVAVGSNIQVLPWACPFDKSICASDGVQFDSGYINVGESFGLNIEKKDSLSYRKRTVCSMLSLTNRTGMLNSTQVPENLVLHPPLPGDTLVTYNYGLTLGEYSGIMRIDLLLTFQSFRIQYSGQNLSAPGVFKTLPELQYPGADIVIKLIVLNNVAYRNAVNDPMFAAHKEYTATDSEGGTNLTLYRSDSPATVTGCTEQYQFCFGSHTNNDTCTSPTGFVEALPGDQWIQELQGWNSIVWAGHQALIADYSIGPTIRDPLSTSYVLPPSNNAEKSLCGMQKMRKPGGFMNINVFGLIFIIVISNVVTIVDLTLLRFIAVVKKIKKFDSPRLDRWVQDGLFHLQRHAYEAYGEGKWEDLTSEVPTTVEQTEFPDLPLRPTHDSLPKSEDKGSWAHHVEVLQPETSTDDTTLQQSTPWSMQAEITQLQHNEGAQASSGARKSTHE